MSIRVISTKIISSFKRHETGGGEQFFLILVFLLHPWFGLLTQVAGAMLLVITIAGEAVNRKSQEKAETSQLEAAGVAASLHRHFQLTATMGLGAVLVLSGDITGGTMIAASIMVARALAPIDQIIGSWRALLEARSARARVLAALTDNDDQGDEAVELPVPDGEISVEGLMLAGSGGQPPRLAQMNFRIPAGKCVGVMGPSGSGKSTLADMLAGATAATIGSVRLDGCDLRHWPGDQRARLIGYLPQVPTLFPGAIAANITRYDENAEDEDIIEAAQLAGVHQLISRMPKGYMTQITSDEGLSGGERQRIAQKRVERAKRAFDSAPTHIDQVVSDDLGLAMLLKLSDSFQQEQIENGRRICVNLKTANDNSKDQSTDARRLGVSS